MNADDPVITIRPTDDTRARFIMRDGTIVTVHFRDGELRACSSRMISAALVNPNVIKLEIAGRIADEACQEINKQAALRRKSGSTKPYAAQELLEEVIKILQERV